MCVYIYIRLYAQNFLKKLEGFKSGFLVDIQRFSSSNKLRLPAESFHNADGSDKVTLTITGKYANPGPQGLYARTVRQLQI